MKKKLYGMKDLHYQFRLYAINSLYTQFGFYNSNKKNKRNISCYNKSK